MLNSSEAELGTNHMGEPVQDVSLPDWAPSREFFLLTLRQALETAPIEQWIDLVFGSKLLGAQA